MASLLDGIDFDSKKAAGPGRRVDPRVLKLSAAATMLLLAGVFYAMQAGIIPWPFGAGQGPQVAQRGDLPTQEEVREIQQQLLQQEQDFIDSGGQIGRS